MTRPAAIRGTYADLKHVKTRAVWQVIVEVPDHDFGALIETIGAPDSGAERWLGIAPLHPPASQQGKASDTQVIPGEVDISTGESSSQPRPRRSWDELTPTQQAGIRCNEPLFQKFMRIQYNFKPDDDVDVADLVRMDCNGTTTISRKNLTTDPHARARWLALENQYQAWLAKQAIA